MCLRIVTDAMERKVGFCDHNRNNDQVSFSASVSTTELKRCS